MPQKLYAGPGFDTSALTGAETVQVLVDLGGGLYKAYKATTQEIADLSPTGNDVTAATSTSGVLTIDCAAGDYFTHALDENVTSWSITNLPGSGKAATKMIKFTQDSTPRTVAWPASFRWAGGTDGVISTGSGAIDVLAITTFDNGTTWIATLNNAYAV